MNHSTTAGSASAQSALPVFGLKPPSSRISSRLLLLAAAGLALSLIWDFSWESTIGIDLVWAPPHMATYLAVALAGIVAIGAVFTSTFAPGRPESGVRLGRCQAPLGAWLALWGALAYPMAVYFDRWWQSAYGMEAGIWHPPQILKAASFFAITAGAWLLCWTQTNRLSARISDAIACAFCGGVLLAFITIMTLPSVYPNRQHSAFFYKSACATYPFMLTAIAVAGKRPWPATLAAMGYTALIGFMVWLLPLIPGKPQVSPIYHQLDHLMPPPFPLLLIVPAAIIDVLLGKIRWPSHQSRVWGQGPAAGLAFFISFFGAQWAFAEFLLTDLADNWFFAGGGRNWPFFLKIDPRAQTQFWEASQDAMTVGSALATAGLAILTSQAGLWFGAWLARVRR